MLGRGCCCACCSRDGDYVNSFDDTVSYPVFTPTATSCDTTVIGNSWDAGSGVVQKHNTVAGRLMFCHKEISDFNALSITFNVTIGTITLLGTGSEIRLENNQSPPLFLRGVFDTVSRPTIRLGTTILATAGSTGSFSSGDVLTLIMTDTGAADGHMDVDFQQNGISLCTASSVDLKCLFNPSDGACGAPTSAAFFFGFADNAGFAPSLTIDEFDFSYHY